MGRQYDDRAWRELSKRVLIEEPVCYRCGRPSTSADHVIPVLEAPHLRLERSNLRGSCAKHNYGRVTLRRQQMRAVVNSRAVLREW